MNTKLFYLALVSQFVGSVSLAGEADVIDVQVSKNGAGSYDFAVTVLHQDAGWDHYANKWDVLDENGNVLETRVLYHPHVDEQPFTRGLSGVAIPQGTEKVLIRAHDSVHGYGGKIVSVDLP